MIFWGPSSMIWKYVSSLFELTAVWRRAAPRLTLHCSTFLYRIQVSLVYIIMWLTYMIIWYIIISLLRDRVLAMARDLLQFRASCAKSNSRHWAAITVLNSENTFWASVSWALSFCLRKIPVPVSKVKLMSLSRNHCSQLWADTSIQKRIFQALVSWALTFCPRKVTDINICMIVLRIWRIHADLTITSKYILGII